MNNKTVEANNGLIVIKKIMIITDFKEIAIITDSSYSEGWMLPQVVPCPGRANNRITWEMIKGASKLTVSTYRYRT
jgi:hypothetical protein